MTNLETALAWLRGMDEHDVNKMFALCCEDMVGREVAEPHPNIGRDAVAATYIDLFKGFPDCKSEILNSFSDTDQCVAEIRWIGTNTGEYRGSPATNKLVDVQIAYLFRFEGGRISRITEYYDGATVVAQMS